MIKDTVPKPWPMIEADEYLDNVKCENVGTDL